VRRVHKAEASENAALELLGTYFHSEYSTETAHVVNSNASIIEKTLSATSVMLGASSLSGQKRIPLRAGQRLASISHER
jgi:hypothetical protein